MKKYRNEWKYEFPSEYIGPLSARLSGVLEPDKFGDDGTYLVRSLYFDDYDNNCAKDTESGLSDRYKYRIRYYNNDNQFLKLERKEKKEGMCHKDSCKLTHEEYAKILNGEMYDLLWCDSKPLLRQLAIDMMTKMMRPKVVIDYVRKAFVNEEFNIRITIDQAISASHELDKFLDGDYLRYAIQGRYKNVLEVKFDDILPGYIKYLINDQIMVRQSFSKYYLGRLKIQDIWRG